MEAIPTGGVKVKADESKTSISITGPTKGVEYIANEAGKIIKKHEEDHERNKMFTVETMSIGKRGHIELMSLMKMDETLREIYPDVSITLQSEEKSVQLEGPAGDIRKVRLRILQFAAEFQNKSRAVSSLMAAVVGCEAMKADLVQKIAHHATAVIDLRNEQLYVCAPSKELLDRALQIVDKTVCEVNIPVSGEAEDLFGKDGWKWFCDYHDSANKGKVKMRYLRDQATVHLCCTTDMRDEMKTKIKEFLSENTS